ncbi:MAG: proteasome subunit beta [Bifidobacteriaceae bacterium]|jgi:proteasome beta subunit|nr:proteasome subunit beta [Bifidobacteriaceae bacterium]
MSGFPSSYFEPGNSFAEFLRSAAPEALEFAGPGPGLAGAAGGSGAWQALGGAAAGARQATTIVALAYRDGVIMAGDRRATQGGQIASREIEKVFPADAATAIGLAGVAGVAAQLARLYQLELEHYEKIEGAPLSVQGKANRLATMLRSQLEWALRGLAAVPLLAGWDPAPPPGAGRGPRGRIFSFDLAGGAYEERDFAAIGSGAVFAKGSLKKTRKPAGTARAAMRAALTALSDAAEEDTGTGGVDRARQIYPVVARVDARGYARVPDGELAKLLGGAA